MSNLSWRGYGRDGFSWCLGAGLLAAALAIGCERLSSVRDELIVTTDAQDATDSRRWLIHYGAVNGQLTFAVFEGSAKGASSVNSQTAIHSTNGVARIDLLQVDGKMRTLPAGYKLIEIIEGRYQDSDDQVSLENFNAFINSKPEAYTIKNLLAFTQRDKAK